MYYLTFILKQVDDAPGPLCFEKTHTVLLIAIMKLRMASVCHRVMLKKNCPEKDWYDFRIHELSMLNVCKKGLLI